jgi:hypothetical protein
MDSDSTDRLSVIPAFLVVAILALTLAGVASALHWAATAPPERVVLVRGANGPGRLIQHDHMACRVWGRLEVCASNDVRWGR